MKYALILLAALAASPALAAEGDLITNRDCPGVTKNPNGSITVASFNLNGGQIVNMQLRTDAIKVAGVDLYTEFDKVCFGAGKK